MGMMTMKMEREEGVVSVGEGVDVVDGMWRK